MTILLGLKYFSKIALYFYAQKYLTYINTTLPSDRQTHALISAILHTGEPKDGIITRRINMVQRESCGDLFLIKKQIINQSLWQQVKILWQQVKIMYFSTRNGIAFFYRKNIIFCRNKNRMSGFQIVTGF